MDVADPRHRRPQVRQRLASRATGGSCRRGTGSSGDPARARTPSHSATEFMMLHSTAVQRLGDDRDAVPLGDRQHGVEGNRGSAALPVRGRRRRGIVRAPPLPKTSVVVPVRAGPFDHAGHVGRQLPEVRLGAGELQVRWHQAVSGGHGQYRVRRPLRPPPLVVGHGPSRNVCTFSSTKPTPPPSRRPSCRRRCRRRRTS